MYLNFIVEYFAPFTFIQSAFMAIFLFSLKKGNKQQNILLALFLLSFGIMVGSRLIWAQFGYNQHNEILGIGTNFRFFIAPFFYLYLRSVFIPGKRFSNKDLLHSLVFVIISINQVTFKFEQIYSWEAYVLCDIVQILAYTVWSFYRFKLSKLFFKPQSLNFEKKFVFWLRFFVISNIVNWFFLVYSLIFVNKIFSDPALCFWFSRLISFTNFIFINSLVFLALKIPELFSSKLNKTSLIPKDKSQKYLVQLIGYMKQNKPYLDPELSLTILAEELAISAKHLSQIINTEFKQNFHQFINSYRVEECKNMLRDKNKIQMNLLQIAYEAGFNSKNTFNTAFKRETGMTPSEFKKKTS